MSLTTQSLISPRMDTLIGGEKVTSVTNSTPEKVYCYLEELREQITPLREELLHHSIYNEVCSLERLREFMQIHVFAVWDFMSLVKRLQGEVTSTSLPWMPPLRSRIAGFANEVV